MEFAMTEFYNSCALLESAPTTDNLEAAKNNWKNCRGVWETSEAFLFGPVSTNNIDPSIDTWPIDTDALQNELAGPNAFTQNYINSLGDELKGFHPAEYLLWGANGNKTVAEFTAREMEFLVALATDLQIKATALRTGWDPVSPDNYASELTSAGTENSLYDTQIAAFEEIVNALAGICDEVANGKISEPFNLQDPSLEESPFSDNSLVDFRNNISGIKKVYFGEYTENGYGVADFVQLKNLQLHNEINAQINQSIASFDGVTVSFGEAIISQPTQVQQIIDHLNELAETLNNDLIPFLQLNIVE
jgi:predicted lipoprotein